MLTYDDKTIIDYTEGGLSEEEAMDFWVHLLTHPEDLELLEFYLMGKAYSWEGEGRYDRLLQG